MLALIACIIFVLATFSVQLGSLHMVALGLAVFAAHFVVPAITPLIQRRVIQQPAPPVA